MLEKEVGPREDCLCLFSVREIAVSLDHGGNNDARGEREEELEWSRGQAEDGASGTSLAGLSTKSHSAPHSRGVGK